MNPSVTNNAQIYRRVKNGDIKGLLGLVCPTNLRDLSLVHSEVETNDRSMFIDSLTSLVDKYWEGF